MSTRQYIGARYVPKFFDWDGSSEWRSGVAYEALTIVTRNGNSYTSKIPVPSNIGAPESNPTYWVATGLYNEQLESMREAIITAQGDIETLDGRMNTAEGDIDTLENNLGTTNNNVTALTNRVTTAETDIDALERQSAIDNSDRIIVLGDSYGIDSAAGGTSWYSRLSAIYGTNMIGQCVGGLGFYSDITSVNANFQSVLTNMTVSDPETIKRIYVFGGANDANIIYGSPSHLSFIHDRIVSFVNYARTRFPNAKIYIGFIGWYRDSGRWNIYYAVRNAYKQACVETKNCTYISGLDYCMHINGCINATDLVHPTQDGSNLLFFMIQQCVVGNCVNPTFNLVTNISPSFGSNFTSVQNFLCKVAYEGAICTITFSGNFNDCGVSRWNVNSSGTNPVYPSKVKLFDLDNWLPIGPYHVDDFRQGAAVNGLLYDGTNHTPIAASVTIEDDGVYLMCYNVTTVRQQQILMGQVNLVINLDNYGFRR